jgi:hypothetical protein
MKIEATKDIELAEVSPVHKDLDFDVFETFYKSVGYFGNFKAAYKKIGGIIEEKKTTKKDVEH